MTKDTNHADSVAIAKSRVGAVAQVRWLFQTLKQVNGGVAIAASSFLATGSMASSFLKTKDVIVYLSASTLV